ncbi:MAG: ATP-binding protein [Actinomycetota bacterium]
MPAVAERRLVSVLFADLVGFTSFSEGRDAEEVRELLSRYFDTCRRLIDRYGGTIEKFIGDAVMAVWGTPAAREDDAERAVRAALDLVSAVSELGVEIGTDLKARAGVLTGEAAVTIGAQGQGMVAGDLVNTASRIQSAAAPGSLLVGDATRWATEASIAYEDAGAHELKGKTEPLQLWRALRVIAGRGGARRTEGLEAPFVGRERGLRMIKDLFHSSAEERTAHLVSVLGVAGIGKTRLTWEFFKYIDGLVTEVWWHQGRCLPYGEGVAFSALAEMVRMRAGIAEGEGTQSSRSKLQTIIEECITDPEERRWLEPRLAHLLGLEESPARDRGDLFSAWRVFFERLAEQSPTILVFDDMQWADSALLDFIEYLLEWSRNHPIFVVASARPEFVDRHPTWQSGKRNFTSIYLDPLPRGAMEDLLTGLVPGLDEETRTKILETAEGVPMYAVEIVRMLIDRGLLARRDGQFQPIGTIDKVDVPQTLQGLIAARLDGLTPEERELLRDASVLGKTFKRDALAALTGLDGGALDPLLASVVRKEVLFLQVDPRSPERGQYGFLQDLVRRVAYDGLSKKERKSRHLAAASYLESSSGADEGELVEVVASHFLSAFELVPNAEDAATIKARAAEMQTKAGIRAASLAASEEAQRYFEQAADLSDEPETRAGLLERAGQMAWMGGRGEAARMFYERSIELFESLRNTHSAARVSARLGEVTWAEGHIEQAVADMERSYAILAAERPDEDLATLAAQLGRFLFFAGRPGAVSDLLEHALTIAESLWLPEVLSQTLTSKGVLLLQSKGRLEEGIAVMKRALDIALENDVPSSALRAYYNLACCQGYRAMFDEAFRADGDGLALARRLGDRFWEWNFVALLVYLRYLVGDWPAVLDLGEAVSHLEDFPTFRFAAVELLVLAHLHVGRGQLDEAKSVLATFEPFVSSSDVQERASYLAASAAVLRAEGRPREASTAALEAVDLRSILGASFSGVSLGFFEAGEAALALNDDAALESLITVIDGLGAGETTPMLKALAARLRAHLVKDEDGAVGALFEASAAILRKAGTVFWLGVTLLDHAEWLARVGRTAEVARLSDEARGVFERLGAVPWLERLDRLAVTASSGAPAQRP